jgi:hypothetical protein
MFTAGCGMLGGELDEDVAERCEELGISVECNTKLYNDQATAIYERLELAAIRGVSPTLIQAQLDIMKGVDTGIDDYARGLTGLEGVAAKLDTVYLFLLQNGDSVDNILNVVGLGADE